MTNEDNQSDISQHAKQAFDQQVESLNSDTAQRLREARNIALSQTEKSVWLSKKWLTGAGAGLAIASVLAFMIVPQLTASKLSPLEDLDMLSADVDMDLYTQLDFYQWLDESLDES
ncbi:hypothetical protein [uncultured Cocleimonas sp.]|uniref:hypothetical protein n=1 Tax=uncultured Cocleimonas sp. TaxID=1051587 RepID=UPI00260455CD|nr:hypothetical protein [uncultured Cocleimonas sp.]